MPRRHLPLSALPPRAAARPPRAAATIVSLVAIVLVTVGFAAAAPADALHKAPGASASHPYSDPVWYPLRGSNATLDCATHNPGCLGAKQHKDNAMTMLSRRFWKVGRAPIYSAQPIYAAGAGILHIGNNVGNRCQYPSSLGTWVWIDHGGGVASRYGHLKGLLPSIHEGMYVTPDTIIGYTGHSGESTRGDCNRATNYLNFQIVHNGIHGTSILMPALKVCVNNQPVSWPQGLRSFAASNWQNVPQTTVLDNSHESPTGCVPTSWMRTARAPWTRSFAPSGTHRLTEAWHTPGASAGVRYVQVELNMYHRANNSWSVEMRRTIRVAGGVPTSTAFAGLFRGRIYRARAAYANSNGWSKWSRWRTATAT